MSDILQAARSYYGLADTDVRKTDIYTNEAGQPMLVFELALSAEDFIAIGARMKTLQKGDERLDEGIIEGPTVEAMREAYNALSKAEKGRYGSFANYMREASNGIVEAQQSWGPSPAMESIMQRAIDQAEAVKKMDEVDYYRDMTPKSSQVVHVDAPEEPEPVSMDAVWLPADECTEAQKTHASDYRSAGYGLPQYLVQWAMLTDEQKQKAKP